METRDKVVQNKPKLYYKETNDSTLEIEYGGNLILITKEKYNNLCNSNKKLKDNNNTLKENIVDMRNKENQLNNKITELKKQYNTLLAEYNKMQSKLQKFSSQQGKGRPVVLTDNHKSIIEQCYARNMSVQETYNILCNYKYKGTYETVRKYVKTLQLAAKG